MAVAHASEYSCNPCTRALAQMHTHQHTQINLSSRLWILFLMLLISIPPNSCNGRCANAYLQSHIYAHPKPIIILPPSHTATDYFNMLNTQLHCSATPSTHTRARVCVLGVAEQCS